MKLIDALRRIALALLLAGLALAPAAQSALAECVAGSSTVCPK